MSDKKNLLVSTRMSLEDLAEWLPEETMVVVRRAFSWLDEAESNYKDEVDSHNETEIVRGCIALMHELVDDFAQWYRWIHGEDAIEELDDEEIFCVRKTYFHIVQRLLLYDTRHSGGTSTCRKCRQLGFEDWSKDINFEFEREEEE